MIDRLDDGAGGRLTLVVAPSGFGKTVLLSQWAARLDASRLAWLSIDARDNDGTRLAARLVDVLKSLEPAIGRDALERVEDSGLAMGESFLDRLLDGLMTIPDSSIVFHNTDELTNPALVDELGMLIEQAPSQLNFVVARHSKWPAGLHGLRLAGGETSLEQSDLAFGHHDAKTLLGRVALRTFTDAQVEKLVTRTEGWAAGLQLAALKLRQEDDPDRFIDAFHGDDRDVAGYLTAEVLAHQPPLVRLFLLQSAVLDRLNGPLCEAVTGIDDGHKMLERLESDGLFLRRIPRSDGWFRYHQLFRDLLRHELRTIDPALVPHLLGRAADWHLGHDDLTQGATYLIAAADWDRLIELLDEHGRSMYESGNASTLLRWLDAVPTAMGADQRDLDLRRATLHSIVGNTRHAQDVVARLATPSMSTAEAVVIDALRCSWGQWHASPSSVMEAADALLANLEVLSPDDVPNVFGLTSAASVRGIASVSRARAIWHQGDSATARVALALTRETPYISWRLHGLGTSALLEAWTGHLRLAEDLARRALGIADDANMRLRPATIDAYLAMAHVLREQNHLRRADRVLDEALARLGRARRWVAQAVLAVERASWYLAMSRPDEGLQLLIQFRATSELRAPTTIDARMRSVEARLLVATGDCDRARVVLQSHEGPWTSDLAAAAVQLAVTLDEESMAKRYLADWPDEGEPRSQLQRDLWMAIVEGCYGNRRQALEHLADVVSIAEPEGHVRLFVDAGGDAARLLLRLFRAAPTPYLRRLVESTPALIARGQGGRGGASQLSSRELAVVRYLPSRLSSAEIAGHLYISLNTLKTHLRSIYRKLDVEGRREAADKAKQQGLA